MAEAEETDEDDKAMLWKISRENTMRKGQWTEETETFRKWVERLKAEYRE